MPVEGICSGATNRLAVDTPGRCAGYTEVMRRPSAIIASAIFLVIAPVTVALYLPWYFTSGTSSPSCSRLRA